MGQFVTENGVEREIVKVVHAKVPGNQAGYVLKYRDQMTKGDVEFGVKVNTNPDTTKPHAK